MKSTRIGVIGAGFSGLSAAAILAANGHDVHVFEKHDTAGGRARQFEKEGFVFDMGPSWYWMPDIFETFFNKFNKTTSDHYDLRKLDPAFRMYLPNSETLDIPANYDDLRQLFAQRLRGGAEKLDAFMREAEYKYKVGMEHLVYKPAQNWLEFVTPSVIKGALRLDITSSIRKHVRKYFNDPALVALMEFPILFLGAMPENAPALYSLMNYAGLKVGTFYPMGGFGSVVNAIETIARENGAEMHYESEVTRLNISSGKVSSIEAGGNNFEVDGVVASADYHHIEQNLIPPVYRKYDTDYWKSRVLAPSSLLFYLGVNRKIDGLLHHNLFFDADLDVHSSEIYKDMQWPTDPLFYVCCPSKTDPNVAPAGKENIFLLMPIAPDLEDTEEQREKYFDIMLSKIEQSTGESIREHIVFKRSYCVKDFKNDYHALRGNAYGLANTLGQTAVLKPKMRSSAVNNLFFAGHLTVPGPGVPPALISGQIAAEMLQKTLNKSTHAAHI